MKIKEEPVAGKMKFYYADSYSSIFDDNFINILVDLMRDRSKNINQIQQKIEVFDFSHSKNIIIYRLNYEGLGEVFLKKYSYDRIAYKFKELLLNPTGLTQLRLAVELTELGISVIEPVASLVFSKGFLNYKSIFVSRGVENSKDWGEIIENNLIGKIGFHRIRTIIEDFAQIWARMLNNNIIHRDPGVGNFLLKNWRSDPEIILVDLDDIFSFPWTPERMKAHALARFKSKFINQILQNSLTYDEKWDEIFLESFWPRYKSSWNYDKFMKTVKLLAEKKLSWRQKRDLR